MLEARSSFSWYCSKFDFKLEQNTDRSLSSNWTVRCLMNGKLATASHVHSARVRFVVHESLVTLRRAAVCKYPITCPALQAALTVTVHVQHAQSSKSIRSAFQVYK